MHRFDHFAVGVANGIVHFSGFETDGPLWTGQGPRTERRHIRFDEAFVRPPVVHVSLTMWDISVGGNQRADVQAIDIDAEDHLRPRCERNLHAGLFLSLIHI